jgi:hypothetical protein
MLYIKLFRDLKKNILPGNGRILRLGNLYVSIAGVLLIEYAGMPVWLAVCIVLFVLVVIGMIIEPPSRGF